MTHESGRSRSGRRFVLGLRLNSRLIEAGSKSAGMTSIRLPFPYEQTIQQASLRQMSTLSSRVRYLNPFAMRS